MAYYDLKKKPSLTTKEGEKETLYPSIVYQGTIPSETILRRVEQRCGFKDGVMAGALMEIIDVVAEFVGDGYRVELGEFGYFSGKIKANKFVARKSDIRSPSIRFTGVNFLPSKTFVKKVSKEILQRSPNVRHRQSKELSADELEKRLMNYLNEHGYIRRTTYSALTGRLKDKALGDLKAFVEKGIIERKGTGSQMFFVMKNRMEK